MRFRIIQCITAGALLWAVADNPYDYYVLLRFLVCPVTGYACLEAYRKRNAALMWSLGLISAIFNPIMRVHLHKETWQVLNAIAAGIILTSSAIQSGTPKSSHKFAK